MSGHIVSEFRSDGSGHRTSNLYRLNVDVSVGVVPPAANVSQKPKPHRCGLGEKNLNRKSAPPKPQTPGVLNRTLHAVGTLNHQIEPPRSREGVSKSENLEVKGRPMLAISSEARDEARKLAHGWDIRELENEWREWNEAQDNVVKDPDRAFIAFCRKRGTHKGARKFKLTTRIPAELKSHVLVAGPGERIIHKLGPEWDHWIEFLRTHAPDVERTARKSFLMAVTAARPYPGCPMPRIQSIPTATARTAA